MRFEPDSGVGMRMLAVCLGGLTVLALALGSPSWGAGKKSVSLSGVQHFSSLPEAEKACGKDTVVWANLRTDVYHLSGSRWFGKTRKGAYFCESAVTKAGVRASKE
ncbi:MAG: hypothetical protein ACREFO_19110 [Acetobacteraceae bacterium]